MSVINRMLRDLDKRQPAGAVEASSSGLVRPVKTGGRQQVSAPVALGVIALAVALGGGAWWLNKTQGLFGFLFPAPAPVPVFKVKQAPASPPPLQVAQAAAVAAVASAPPTPTHPAPAISAAASAAQGAASPTQAATRVAKASPAVQAGPGPAAPATAAKPAAPAPAAAAAEVPAPAPALPARAPALRSRAEDAASPSQPAEPAGRGAGGKTYSPGQVNANLMAEAVRLDQQGRMAEAMLPLQRLLKADPMSVDARRMLVQLQLETGRLDEARALLAEGRQLLPANPGFAMALARLQLESGDAAMAAKTLQESVQHAGQDPPYHALLAAAQLKVQQFENSAQNYLIALRAEPANPNWLVGVGLAWEGMGKRSDALEAYRRADTADNLPPELSKFIAERISRLGR